MKRGQLGSKVHRCACRIEDVSRECGECVTCPTHAEMYIQRAEGTSEGTGLEFKVQLWTVQLGSASVRSSGSTLKTISWPHSANIIATAVRAAHLLNFQSSASTFMCGIVSIRGKKGPGTARDGKGDSRIWTT